MDTNTDTNKDTDLIILEPLYETDEGLEFMDPNDYKTIHSQIAAGKFRMGFYFQSVDGACIYGVTNKDTWQIDHSVYTYLHEHPYNRRTLFKLLLLGHFDIGVTRIGNYHLIKEITPYSDDRNSEINLHYMCDRSEPGNIAWRSITWDLFEPFVRKMYKENEEEVIV